MNTQSRNLIFAIVSSLAILFVFDYFFSPTPSVKKGQDQVSLTPEQKAKPLLGPQISDEVLQARESSDRIVIQTPRIRGSISLTGGFIDDVVLKDYRKTLDKDSDAIHLLNYRQDQNHYVQYGWSALDSSVVVPDHHTQWKSDRTTLTPDHPVTLTWNNGHGLIFERKISIDDQYMFTLTQSVRHVSGQGILTLSPYGLISRGGQPNVSGYYILHEGPIGVMNGQLEEVDYGDLENAPARVYSSEKGWLGITDKYWLTALIPHVDDASDMRFLHQKVGGQDKYQADFLAKKYELAPGKTVSYTSHLFVGAKKVDILDGYARDLKITHLDLAIDFGWFYFMTKPFFKTLQFFNDILGNYGLAILLITVFIKILFFPLANKSYVAMSKMKKLQPDLMKIRDKYADDRVRQQQEMMAFYKKYKVNPAAGCLPILIQIPVFFALYKVLFVSIEMRHAPFFGWIEDLSARDPTSLFNLFGLLPWDPPSLLMVGIWPLLMGLTMFWQQRLNPPPTDPVQQKVMGFLPVIFTFMLSGFPAGLVIYWAWNNFLSIMQQRYIMWKMDQSE